MGTAPEDVLYPLGHGRTDQRTSPQDFEAVQVQRVSLRTDEQIFDFVEKHGIDRKKFAEMYKSFYVRMLGNKAVEMQSTYEIEGVPMIIIDGKYLTSPAIVSSGNQMDLTEQEMHVQTLKVMDALVAKAQKEKAASRKGPKKRSNKYPNRTG